MVLASGGYPQHYEKGKPITGLVDGQLPGGGATVYHAGTALADNVLVTSGGRVLGVTAVADSLFDAVAAAYGAADQIGFEMCIRDRENTVRIKLNPIADTVKGRRVVLVDDSIVRGTTSKQIVQLLREAGAKEVHFRSSAPKFLYPCYFGTDIDSRENLIAANYSTQEIADMIGVDSLGFLSVEGVKQIAENCRCDFCTGCFTGEYPSAPPQVPQKSKFEHKIGAAGD